MKIELLMGNQAIAMGAIRAGVGVVTGYPGNSFYRDPGNNC